MSDTQGATAHFTVAADGAVTAHIVEETELERLRRLHREHRAKQGPKCKHTGYTSRNQYGEESCGDCGWAP